MKILYIGWVGYKNIGDELMLNNFKQLVAENTKEKYTIEAKMCNENFNDFERYDVICLGGGSILLEGFINILFRAIESGKKIMIWGSGYDDIFDEEFWLELEKADFAYIYSDETEAKLERIAQEASFFGVRGPMTYLILKKSNIDMKKIVISGDPGFLLKENTGLENPYQFTKSDNYVGINVGTMFNRIYGGDENKLFEELIKVANELLEIGYKIYLYTMWPKDTEKVLEFYNKIENKNNVILDLENRSGEKLLTIIKNCVFTINFKLHANVISASAKVPFVCLAYRVKCYDFMKSINQENLLVSTGSERIYEEIIRKIKYINKNSEKISAELELEITNYRKILKESISNL